MRIVRKTNVRKSDILAAVDDPAEALYHCETMPAARRGVYDRIRVAMGIFGLGHFTFERERDDRG